MLGLAMLAVLLHPTAESQGNDPAPPSGPLRTDGPTLEEYVKAGYSAESYPPTGYAPRTTPATKPDTTSTPETAPAKDGDKEAIHEGDSVTPVGPDNRKSYVLGVQTKRNRLVLMAYPPQVVKLDEWELDKRGRGIGSDERAVRDKAFPGEEFDTRPTAPKAFTGRPGEEPSAIIK